ncbi:MAG TPA: dihydrofolate reductase family protein [Gammaproteobacteria bacterium]|nr:dihydrofolate reductase family protein [Gammaproteobacteria bacterium]
MPPTDELLQVFPAPARNVPLRGLYLNDTLRPAGTPERPFVYANFITSLDGRISLPDPENRTRKVPGATANPRDWRLFQELAACADVLVTSGRYIRDLSGGVAQADLPVLDKPEFADLLDWRISQGLARQPALAVVSASLDLSIPDGLAKERPVYVVTGEASPRGKAAAIEAQGAHLLIGGDGLRVEGYRLVSALAREGFANIAMIGGAELLNTLLVDNVFDRLYLTQAHRILGGLSFDTLLKGRQLNPPADFSLRSLCFDTAGDFEQSFAVYDRAGAAVGRS